MLFVACEKLVEALFRIGIGDRQEYEFAVCGKPFENDFRQGFRRQFPQAGAAPGSPEVQQHDFATQGCKREIPSGIFRSPEIGRQVALLEQAVIVQKQSAKIKELVQDLNLVSQLEYEMQPLHKEGVRLSKLLRSYVADLLNTGISDSYNIEIEIAPDAENAVLECDARLISRSVNNLVQNSMKHNPKGCEICLSLAASQNQLILAVTDNGTGLSAEKLQELEEKPHYMESTDERLDLRHGLGLLIVGQVAIAHHGTFAIASVLPHGCSATLTFPC